MSVSNITILGLQWGDEGKGKVVDRFSSNVDIVVRFCGGANAGHTVVVDGPEKNETQFILHLLPTGIIHPEVRCFIGAGVVCDPVSLFEELDDIKSRGIDWEGRLFIDYTTHLVLPQHKACEKYSENINTKKALATTLRGIGPTYADKADRIGITAGDLADDDRLRDRIDNFIKKKKPFLSILHDQNLSSPEKLHEFLKPYAYRIKAMLTDVTFELRKAISDNKRILFEGAQGALLDIGLGTYPYVTSSNTTIGGLFYGLGLPPGIQGEVLGVVKAYTTRVGNGPFPTELKDATGERLRKSGDEFGATTGRPRRTGWLDLATVRRTAFMSGVTGIVITKLDVLDGLDQIKVCIAHRYNNTLFDFPPLYSGFMEKVEPIYEKLKGWQSPTAGITDFEKLPVEAKNYIKFIEKTIGLPVKYISTGSNRKAFIEIS
ncbi:MAG: adenylosuccinate synthase [candidate division Zixibacteria bacterium 4484_95]|nr:MAG: adenylosuccinate synthase [candidate division Zixibacteria bacterium 4484_95]